MTPRVLLAGIATRAFAQSAARAGYEVVAVDGFADADLVACARVIGVRESGAPFSAARAARLGRAAPCDAVTYVAPFENHAALVRTLAGARALWGNSPAALDRVRNPVRLARTLGRLGFAVPAVRLTPPAPGDRRQWLMKPRRSGGGHDVMVWHGRRSQQQLVGRYFQERITGTPGSVVFAAAGGRAVALGFSRLLVGEAVFGAGGFRYAGNIVAAATDPQFAAERSVLARTPELVAALADAFDLVGVNGLDFIARRGIPYPVEVNPRYTAAMELVERLYGISIFETHARACTGELMAFDLPRAHDAMRGAIGKAIVYARADCVTGDTRPWLEDPAFGDIPHPGARIARGRPICSVFAQADTAVQCRRALARQAARVYRSVRATERRTA